MNLYESFLAHIQKEGFSGRDIRFLGAHKLLKEKASKYRSINDYSKKIGINNGSLSYMLIGKRAIPLSLLDKNMDLSKYKVIIGNSNIPIRIPKEMTKELAYLVGVLRDGTVSQESKDEYVVAFYNTNKELLKTVSSFLRKIFDIEPVVEKHWSNVYRVRVRSKTLYLFFKLIFSARKKQADWDTPKLIRKSNDLIKKYYITGFFDAEGGCPNLEKKISKKRKNMYIKFVQKNKESLIFIKEHLGKANIQTGKIYWGDGEYVFKISNSSIPSFCRYVKPFHSLKALRLKLLYENFTL